MVYVPSHVRQHVLGYVPVDDLPQEVQVDAEDLLAEMRSLGLDPSRFIAEERLRRRDLKRLVDGPVHELWTCLDLHVPRWQVDLGYTLSISSASSGPDPDNYVLDDGEIAIEIIKGIFPRFDVDPVKTFFGCDYVYQERIAGIDIYPDKDPKEIVALYRDLVRLDQLLNDDQCNADGSTDRARYFSVASQLKLP